MVLWNLDPVLLSAGPLEIRWYGLFYALGFLLGYLILKKSAKELGITRKDVEDYILLLVMGGILSARIFYVLVYNPLYYFANPLQIPAVWQGGLSIHGGLLGAILVTWFFCKKKRVNFYALADLLVVPLALAMVFVRIANYLNGELWGTVTSVPWCVEFPWVDGCRHPSQLYEAAYSMVLFWMLFLLQQGRRLTRGVLFWLFIGGYGLFRFLVTFLREPDPTDPLWLGIALGQWLSLAMVLAALAWLGAFLRTGHPILRES